MKGKGVGGECAGKGGQISDDWLTDWFSTEHSTYLYSCNEMRTFTFVVSIFDNIFLSIKHVHTSNVLVVFQFADSVPQARLPSPSPLKHVYTSNVCNVCWCFSSSHSVQTGSPRSVPHHLHLSNMFTKVTCVTCWCCSSRQTGPPRPVPHHLHLSNMFTQVTSVTCWCFSSSHSVQTGSPRPVSHHLHLSDGGRKDQEERRWAN